MKDNSRLLALAAVVAAGLLLAAFAPAPLAQQEGFDDTPFLPGGKWRVHDSKRPNPPVVTPGKSGAPPSDAIVLFDGTGLSAWVHEDGNDPQWRLVDGAMEVKGGGPLCSREHFGDCQLHVEWATPAEVKEKGQFRGNSGVLLMGFYEVQILDSYDNRTYADGQAGAIYGQTPPLVNASRGPGAWQSYDIVFRAPVFDGEEVVKKALLTVFHNGVLVQDDVEVLGAVAYRALPEYRPHPAEGPLVLQDHWYPVRFRNVWIRRL
ncbi:MAG: DUF1080 domain-containing protein [Planctomycetota bacterium]